jgi:hypothetical protein
MASPNSLPTVAVHGALRLPSVDVDSYNLELKDDEGFIGDRASKGAFRKIIENWRKELRKVGVDPLGENPSGELSKKELDEIFARATPRRLGLSTEPLKSFLRNLPW